MTNSLSDVVIACALSILLMVGGYQIYFLPQKRPWRPHKTLLFPMDDRVPFRPGWVWTYSLMYYPLILVPILTLSDFRQYAYTAANFIILLLCQVTIAYLLPVKTPAEWRQHDLDSSASMRFLRFIQSIDRGGNCFPSMHISVATLALLHVLNNISQPGLASVCIALGVLSLISLSALFTKQHYVVDIPAGVALAVVVYSIHGVMYI